MNLYNRDPPVYVMSVREWGDVREKGEQQQQKLKDVEWRQKFDPHPQITVLLRKRIHSLLLSPDPRADEHAFLSFLFVHSCLSSSRRASLCSFCLLMLILVCLTEQEHSYLCLFSFSSFFFFAFSCSAWKSLCYLYSHIFCFNKLSILLGEVRTTERQREWMAKKGGKMVSDHPHQDIRRITTVFKKEIRKTNTIMMAAAMMCASIMDALFVHESHGSRVFLYSLAEDFLCCFCLFTRPCVTRKRWPECDSNCRTSSSFFSVCPLAHSSDCVLLLCVFIVRSAILLASADCLHMK